MGKRSSKPLFAALTNSNGVHPLPIGRKAKTDRLEVPLSGFDKIE